MERVISKSALLGSVGMLVGGSASALLVALAVGPSGATATLVVDTLADGVANATDCRAPVTDACSLRDALAAASSGDAIVFKAGLAGTIRLAAAQSQLHISKGMSVAGPGADLLTIDSTDVSQGLVFFINGASADVAISGMTLTGGSNDNGGAVQAVNDGDVTLTDVVITGNVGKYGGAIYANNLGDLTIIDSSITGNTSTLYGGGLRAYHNVDNVRIINSQITGNSSAYKGGGGQLLQSGDLVVVDSVISNNTAATAPVAANGGGGFYTRNGGSTTISGSTFSDNNASGSTPTSGNYLRKGGALYFGSANPAITISNSTFDGNSGGFGGALAFGAWDQVVIIDNSTIAGNSAQTGSGGGIWKTRGGSLMINQGTITENEALGFGCGVYVDGHAGATALVLSGSIVSANSLTSPAPTAIQADAAGISVSGFPASDGVDIGMSWGGGDSFSMGHSLVGTISSVITVTDLGGNISSATPGLSPLADNGGNTMTMTMALLANSVAIDAGPDPVATFVGNEFDQRGAPWARVFNGRVDIGAFEAQSDPTPPTTEGSTPSTEGIATDEPVVPNFTG